MGEFSCGFSLSYFFLLPVTIINHRRNFNAGSDFAVAKIRNALQHNTTREPKKKKTSSVRVPLVINIFLRRFFKVNRGTMRAYVWRSEGRQGKATQTTINYGAVLSRRNKLIILVKVVREHHNYTKSSVSFLMLYDSHITETAIFKVLQLGNALSKSNVLKNYISF